jgi:predicted ATPase/DNA-binding SARP family transcriptional activator
VAIEVRILGPLEIVGDDGPVTLGAPKHRRLLAALALGRGRTCSVDELVEAVWGPSPPASARKLVQIYVGRLRQALPFAPLLTDGPGYALRLEPGALDAERFERQIGDATAALGAGNAPLAASLAERALALWRGAALADVAYEEFARAEAERLEELRLVGLELHLDAQLQLGRDVLADALALGTQHPLRERPQALAMLALYRAGRQGEALDVFVRTRGRLREELGLEPGPELRELQRRILQQDPELDAVGEDELRARLPAPASPIVGREHELAALQALLDRRDIRLLVLTGAGGSGKTRLALEAARAAAPSFANGVVLVELAPLRDPELVVPTIAHAAGLGEPQGQSATALGDALRDRELLLVLDNAEHLRPAAPAFVELLAQAPRLTVLVTSRSVLHVSGEHVFPVAPLDEEASVTLFEQRARALDPSFALTAENRPVVSALCRRVDGLPLAIELAAARIRTLTPQALLDRLDDRLTVLTGGQLDLPARQQTLRETLDWSVELLGEQERRVLARLSVFPGGATFDAAQEVCGADPDSLGGLVDNSMVRRTDAAGEARFVQLETIREYGLTLLGDGRDDAEFALARYLCDLVERAELRGPEQARWIAVLDVELDNLRTALDFLAGRPEPEPELQLAGALWRYWWVRGHLAEGAARLDGALARGAGVVSRQRARALQGRAGLAVAGGDYDVAAERGAEAIEVARETGAQFDEMAAHTVLGVVANARKDFPAARHHHGQSLLLAEHLGLEPTAEKLNLANVSMNEGDTAAAVPLLSDVLEHHRREGVTEGVGFASLNLGLALYDLGEHEKAHGLFAEARDAFTELGFRAHVAHALQGLAACEAGAGRHEEAARLLARANAELQDVGWSGDDFDAELGPTLEAELREALGDERYAAIVAEAA